MASIRSVSSAMTASAHTKMFQEPHYVLPAPANDLLSSSAGERPVRIAPPALRALNLLLDELLFAWTHAAVTATLANSPQQQFNTSANGEAGQAAAAATLPNLAPLGPNEALTTDRFKFAVTRHAGSLGKEAVLESELAIREIISTGPPSLRGDSALRRGSFAGSYALDSTSAAVQAEEIFRALRVAVQAVSALGAAYPRNGAASSSAPDGGPLSLSTHLVRITPLQPVPVPSPHVTPLAAVYAERALVFFGEHFLRALAVTVDSSKTHSLGATERVIADAKDLETTLAQDHILWELVRGTRVRAFIEREASLAAAASSDTKTDAKYSKSSDANKSPSQPATSPNPVRSFTAGTITPPHQTQGSMENASPLRGVRSRESVSSDKAPGNPQRAAQLRSMGSSRGAGGTRHTNPPSPRQRTRSHSSLNSLGSANGGGGANAYAAGETSATQMRQGAPSFTSSLTGASSRAPRSREASGLSMTSDNNPREDDFEKLMLSGQTMKVSLTPNRLRSMDSPSGSRAKRLQARSPRADNISEDEQEELDGDDADEDDEDILGSKKVGQRKESLIELLSSPPPWMARSRSTSKSPVRQRRDEDGDTPPLPSQDSAPQQQQDYLPVPPDNMQASSVISSPDIDGHSTVSAMSSPDSMFTDLPSARAKRSVTARMRPKDERRDTAVERQVNHDLAMFLESAPPPPPAGPLSAPSSTSRPATLFSSASVSTVADDSPTKRRPGLRGLMSRVRGRRDDSGSSTATTAVAAALARGDASSLMSSPTSGSDHRPSLAYGGASTQRSPSPRGPRARETSLADMIPDSPLSATHPTAPMPPQHSERDTFYTTRTTLSEREQQQDVVPPMPSTEIAALAAAGAGASGLAAAAVIHSPNDNPETEAQSVIDYGEALPTRAHGDAEQSALAPSASPVLTEKGIHTPRATEAFLPDTDGDEVIRTPEPERVDMSHLSPRSAISPPPITDHEAIVPLLRILRLQMANARSAEECKALLDSFIEHSTEDARSRGSASPRQGSPVVEQVVAQEPDQDSEPVEEEAAPVVEVQDGEGVEASLVECMLGELRVEKQEEVEVGHVPAHEPAYEQESAAEDFFAKQDAVAVPTVVASDTDAESEQDLATEPFVDEQGRVAEPVAHQQ